MSKFKILSIWPPSVPTYFNAGHHLPLWEVSAFLRREVSGAQVDIVDAGVLNYTWKEVADLLIEQYDLICIVNEYDNVEGVRRLAEYAHAVSPSSKIITFGRVSGVIPEFFCQSGVNAIVIEGDFEASVLDYVSFIRDEKALCELQGLLVKINNNWNRTAKGRFLDATDWAYPPVEELPLTEYARISSRPQNRFSALPGKRELTISVARGCPVGCDYCLVPMYQGRKERRRPVGSVISYIAEAKLKVDFDYVSMYAPTFSLNRNWTLDFCEQVKKLSVPWKCCTTIRHLDESLVREMGECGCVRISVGLETLDTAAQRLLPKLKHISDPQLELLANWCKKAEIELNCFVMVGMPEQTAEGLNHTFDYLQTIGVKIRPTAYTPYQNLKNFVTEVELSAFFTRQITERVMIDGLSPQKFYEIEFTAEATP